MPDFGFRRARHDGAVGVAHDDVAQAQGGAAVLVALDLGAADRDGVLAAEILLDRRLQPRRRHIEFDRAARQTPPQAGDGDRDEREGERRAPEHPPHQWPAHKPDQRALQPSIGGGHSPDGWQWHACACMDLLMLADAGPVTRRPPRGGARPPRGCRMLRVLVVACHALAGAPRPARCASLAAGGIGRAARGPYPWNRLRPPDASGNCDIDGSKTTKGRHMARELAAGDKAPAFTLPRDGGDDGVVEGLQGPQSRPLFLSEGRHARAAPRKLSHSQACAPPLPRPEPRSSASRPIRWRRRTNSNPSTSSRSRSPPTRPRRCWKPMAPGARNRCTGASSWASSARPS